MPIYRCTIQPERLDDGQKETIAAEITRIHCSLTNGTPTHFVHVIFEEVPAGNGFCGGKPSRKSLVVGAVRAGRPEAVKTQLLTDISQMWVKVTGQSEEDVVVGLIEVPARNLIEGGWLLPEPGEEDAWLAEHGLSADA